MPLFSHCQCVSIRGHYVHIVQACILLCRRVCAIPTVVGIVVIWVKILQTALMVEIYSKSLVRAIGKVLLMKFS